MAYVIHNRKGIRMSHYGRFNTMREAEAFLHWWFSGMVPEMTIREENHLETRFTVNKP